MTDSTDKRFILHVLVVGFHHKKGCQVEYAFPPFTEDLSSDSTECPPGWQYLPTLALPDGSHNYAHDTVYFHLPSLHDPHQTIFGISCYRQISVDKVKNRTSDLTRDTVQKAVCVLSTVPLYGHIEVKMSLITHAYFEEGDFTKVALLQDTYNHLNACLKNLDNLTYSPQIFVGLSARDFIVKFGYKAVLLFKLLLLEKKLIFYCSPVHKLCSVILSLLSLHPGMIEEGLQQSACFNVSRPMSPIPTYKSSNDKQVFINGDVSMNDLTGTKQKREVEISSQQISSLKVSFTRFNSKERSEASVKTGIDVSTNDEEIYDVVCKDEYDITGDVTIRTNLSLISHLDLYSCGMPLAIFTEGYLCLPYLSLPYMDVLSDPNIRGYIVGATNVLFKQKKNLADVLVEVENAKVETDDMELKKLLHLSMEDLRFADYMVKHVSEEKQDIFIDGVGWEGGDEWIRMQFKVYLLSLLRVSLLPENCRETEYFNSSFVSSWKNTNSYKKWHEYYNDTISDISPCHPFAGQLSVSDMKLKISHSFHSSEKGKKINQAMLNTGKAVATTGRAVGGAFSQARGAVTNWWSNFTTVSNIVDASSVPDNTDYDVPDEEF